jgi:hypothetical protein
MTGAGFAPGPLTLAIDAVGGAVLATPTAHSIIARDSKGAQASDAVFAQLPAQQVSSAHARKPRARKRLEFPPVRWR